MEGCANDAVRGAAVCGGESCSLIRSPVGRQASPGPWFSVCPRGGNDNHTGAWEADSIALTWVSLSLEESTLERRVGWVPERRMVIDARVGGCAAKQVSFLLTAPKLSRFFSPTFFLFFFTNCGNDETTIVSIAERRLRELS